MTEQLSLLELRACGGELVSQPRGYHQHFASPYSERRGEPISFRLPMSVDVALRSAVGWQGKADNPKLKAAIENVILLWLQGDDSRN